jgi:murein DD-endopeptidase MepM/ murein hydrolase activator NlpD
MWKIVRLLPLMLAVSLAVAPADAAYGDTVARPGPGGGPWRAPLDGPAVVLRAFAPPPEPWRAGHRGVDLAAEPGAAVRAAGAGVVAFAGRVAGMGTVSVDHGDLRTTYLPVRAEVARGDPVAAGDRLGTVVADPPHCGTRICLHWGLRRGRDYLDPMALIGRGGVRLLPLYGPPRAGGPEGVPGTLSRPNSDGPLPRDHAPPARAASSRSR